MIYGNAVGGTAPIKTLVLVDENGTEITGVVTGSEVIFTADPKTDIRAGKIAATDQGIVVGEKIIPPYYTSYGSVMISANSNAVIAVPEYEYTYLMATIYSYNVSEEQSVIPTYVSIGDKMYSAVSGEQVSDIVIDAENAQINLGVTVNEDSVLRYCVVKEEY